MSQPPLTAAQQRLVEWSKAQVSALAGYPDDSGQISRYLLSLSSKQQLLDYAHNLFGSSNNVTVFINDLWSRRVDPSSASRPALQREDSDDAPQPRASNPYGVIDNDRPNRPSKPSSDPSPPPVPSSAPLSAAEAFDPARFRGVKIKFAKPKKGQAPAAVARSVCSCQARQHELFTNCTVCGRILCVVEGEGPCPHCSSTVTRTHTKPADAFIEYMEGLNTSGRNRASKPSNASSSEDAAAAAGLEKAEAQKRRLLGFADANVARSRVVDQQSDFYEFEANAWLAADDKKDRMAEALKEEEKLHRRRDHTVSIDLVTGQVVAHSSDPFAAENQGKPLHGTGVQIITKEDEDRARVEGAQRPPATDGRTAARAGVADPAVHRMFEEMKTVSRAQYFSNDTLVGKARAVYEQMEATLDREEKTRDEAKRSHSQRPRLFTSRLQHEDDASTATFDQEEAGLAPSLWGAALDDDEPLAPAASFDAAGDDEPDCNPSAPSVSPAPAPTRDNGTTLSMHQPWASLLVLGIKRFEGRGWSTPYRGRLWIASTAHQCTAEEAAQLEAEYRAVYPGLNVPFPSSYPHSALLGCVELVDVVAQEEFQRLRRVRGEKEDSASAYIFVCERPQVLPLPISISGQHKSAASTQLPPAAPPPVPCPASAAADAPLLSVWSGCGSCRRSCSRG